MTDFLAALAADPVALAVGVIVAAFVSEDLTCIGVGLLVAAGKVSVPLALAACFAGVVLGDFAVWFLGRAGGRPLLRWRFARRLLPEARLAGLSRRLCDHGGRAVVAARFLPGTRVPLLLAAGVVGACPYRFLAWAAAAAAVWTPLLVLSVAWAGASVGGIGWLAIPAVGGAGFLGLKALPRLFDPVGRAKLVAAVSRVWRWEFWPAWVFYLPLVPRFLLLAARYRSLTVWTAANPGIAPAGGVVGESKADILAKLPAEWVVPTLLIPPGEIRDRTQRVREAGWDFPVILKPDVGERGAGVRKAHDLADAEKYLLANPGPVVVQPFHPGPFEAGVFYYRLPGEARGHVFSITDKVFPVVTGDGRSTLEGLIWAHPRFRMQAAVFLDRHAAHVGRVLAAGERFALATAGNHCQGTLFRDGGHLLTPELEAAFDAIAGPFDGFFVGRFDVRYADPAAFRAGRGFAVVELNGVSSESTNLYDPTWPLWRAYRTLFRQWALLFRIGDANRRAGHRPATAGELLALVREHRRNKPDPRAD
jgi:membrane protein DedA with SNARE-associated domain